MSGTSARYPREELRKSSRCLLSKWSMTVFTYLRLLRICCTDFGDLGKKISKGKEEEGERDYVHSPRLPHCIAGLAYEALPEVGERFAERVGERLARLLRWSGRKQPQHRTYDAFFKNVKLHVYATLRPTDAEAQLPYFSTLMPYDEPSILILDDIAGTVVMPQFNASGSDDHDGEHAAREDSEKEASEGRRSEKQTSGGDEEKGASGSDPDGGDSKDTGESHGEGSSASEDTRGGARDSSSSPWPPRDPSPERRSTMQVRAIGTSAPSLSRRDVEELLLDQRILFEMRFRIVKLYIQQHVTSECTILREFLGTLCDEGRNGGRHLGFFTRSIVLVSYNFVDVYGGPVEPCPYESDIAIDKGNMQDVAHITPMQDDLNLLVPAASEEVQDAGAMESSNDVEDDDEEADGCNVMDGNGVVTEVPAPGPILKARTGVPTTT
ncbi:Hypothetical predicted protein [Olea europaea subsp. europaea]|uniref:Uncharacterized protein n=1 Tax=Olea europaea subsp. europaea TaxID=158383 RepID=A0A8S0RKY9_OLEEU|nr:Hypothetical predicted protein [Olea europaea subsp. europaea]